MKVWVLLYNPWYDEYNIVGIFDSLKKAQDARGESGYPQDCNIEEWDVQ